MLVEAAVTGVEEAVNAVAEGAGRLEVCSFAVEGGFTPFPSVTREVVAAVRVPAHVLIRPRGGDFVYSQEELGLMEEQIEAARAAGAAGVVLGALLTNHALDRTAMTRLLACARPLAVTFHRAIDVAHDPVTMIRELVELGVDRVLTSGGAPTALEGVATIRNMVGTAAGGLVVMAGGGIRASNVREVVARTGVAEVHARDVRGIRH